MCLKQSKPEEPAAAPAPPLPAPDAPAIGDSRRKEARDQFGQDAPSYRVKRTKKPAVNPSAPIQM